MWRHYLSMAARGILHQRLYTLINIASLAVGLTCAIFVILFVRDELSYDKWIPDTGNLYRVELMINVFGREQPPTAVTPYPLLVAMRDQIPGVTGVTRLVPQRMTITSGDRQFAQEVDVVDPGFFKVIRLPLLKGEPGSVFRQPESVVLSQSAAKTYFGDADPIGRTLTVAVGNCTGGATACPQISLRVTGVARADAKLQGARERVMPMIYMYIPNYPMNISVRLRPERIPQTLNFIDQTWHSFVPTVAIPRAFLDGAFDELYRADDRVGAMFGVIVFVAVLIGCLGLYGLAVFTAERRTKEIGIRKASGARTGDIVRLMLWRISLPVLVANLIAWPVAYAYLRHWLDGYAYRIDLSPLYFLAAAAVALLIAWATVYGNTLRLARTSPIHALRYE